MFNIQGRKYIIKDRYLKLTIFIANVDTATKPKVLLLKASRSAPEDLETRLGDFDITSITMPDNLQRELDKFNYKVLVVYDFSDYTDRILKKIRETNEKIKIIEASDRFGDMKKMAQARLAGVSIVYAKNSIESGLLKLAIGYYFKV